MRERKHVSSQYVFELAGKVANIAKVSGLFAAIVPQVSVNGRFMFVSSRAIRTHVIALGVLKNLRGHI